MTDIVKIHSPSDNKLKENVAIAIILLNWNGNADTLECLSSIKKYAYDGLNLLIVLVDNASATPLDLLEVRQIIPDLLYIENNENGGFADGNNIGIKEALKYNPKYLFLLNNDTALVDDSLQRMYRFMEERPEFGIAGAVNYYYSEPETIWQAGLINDFRSGTQKQITDFDKQSSSPIEVDYVPGSSLMVRTDIAEKSGLLDPRYFAYYEENDFCLSVKKQGYKVGFIPNTRILHKVGQSADSVVKFYLKNRNRLLFYRKYSPTPWFISILIKESVKNFIKATVFCLENKSTSFMKGYYYALRDYFGKRYYSGSMYKLQSKSNN